MLDQASRLRSLVNNSQEVEVSNKAKIITVTSGKGGVGKSNFVVNLSIFLSRQGNKVLIFDADLGMGNDDVLMGVYPKFSVFDILKGKSIKDIMVEGPEGVMLLPGGSGVNQIEDLKEEQRALFLEKLKELDGFDFIIIDTGAGVNRSVLAFIACSEEVVVITTPEPTSLTDAYSLLKAANHFKIKESANVVINRAFDYEEGMQTFENFKKAVHKFLQIKVEFLGVILEDKNLVKGVRRQEPFIINNQNTAAARGIGNIGLKLMGQNKNKGLGAKGLFERLMRIFS